MPKLTWEVRLAAQEFIEMQNRPVSVGEIREYFKTKPELQSLLNGRSEDYVRVTLATTPKPIFTRYQTPEMEGREIGTGSNEARRLYFGKAGVIYGNEWREICPSVNDKNNVRVRSSRRSCNKSERKMGLCKIVCCEKGEGESSGCGCGCGEVELGKAESGRLAENLFSFDFDMGNEFFAPLVELDQNLDWW